jgi:hypothetical protein
VLIAVLYPSGLSVVVVAVRLAILVCPPAATSLMDVVEPLKARDKEGEE